MWGALTDKMRGWVANGVTEQGFHRLSVNCFCNCEIYQKFQEVYRSQVYSQGNYHKANTYGPTTQVRKQNTAGASEAHPPCVLLVTLSPPQG